MAVNIAINGFGRIGRNVIRALHENGYAEHMRVVAINDLGDAKTNAHLLKYDSIHGVFNASVQAHEQALSVEGEDIAIYSERDPLRLPWEKLDVDIVFECTGLFTSREKAYQHIEAGAKRVLISAPGKNADATLVYGVNHLSLRPEHKIISNASCTTNCLAPMANILHQAIGIKQGSMTTIHSYTNDQSLSDAFHPDLHRARAAALSMIPTKTGAASAVGLVLPELAGRLDGMAVRVPTANVSLVDLTFIAEQQTSVEEVNDLMKRACETDPYGVIASNDLPLVSIDFNHNPASCTFDSSYTKVSGSLVKVLAWYDNEWGFANRMLDNAKHIGQVSG